MSKIYKIRRKSDGLFWKPRRASYKRSSDVVFDENGKEFGSSGAAKNSFIAHTKDFGTGTVRRNQPERDPNDFELVVFEQVLTETTTLELKE
jgi:hypothetical protein